MLYPNNIKKNQTKKNISYANRGMDLEHLINEANDFYLKNDIAVIYKRPTPIQINKVSYSNGMPEVSKGLFNQKSTLDYVGIYKGKYIDFDAKKTLNYSNFPLSNIHLHQIKHIENVLKHGGISFLIIDIKNEVYVLKGNVLLDFINNNARKSIPYEYIKNNASLIEYGYSPVLDYIKVIDKLYF